MDIGAASSAGPLIKYASAPEKFDKQINELLSQRINERSATKAAGTGSATIQTAGDKTVNVKITLPNGQIQNVPTTEDGSAALLQALKSAKLSAGY